MRDMFIEDGLKGVDGFALSIRGVATDLCKFGEIIYRQAKFDLTSPKYKLPTEADTTERKNYLAELFDYMEGIYDKEGAPTNAINLRKRYLAHYQENITAAKNKSNKK
jgi:hypothetical protein